MSQKSFIYSCKIINLYSLISNKLLWAQKSSTVRFDRITIYWYYLMILTKSKVYVESLNVIYLIRTGRV